MAGISAGSELMSGRARRVIASHRSHLALHRIIAAVGLHGRSCDR